MRLAIVGDIHGDWDERDNAYFEASPVDLVLFTGDLASYVGMETFRIAAVISRLRKPYAVIAGNHDCVTLSAFLGELAGTGFASRLHAKAIAARYRKLQEIFGARLVGYSALDAAPFTVVGARPMAMDGARLTFAQPLRRLFGIQGLADSAARISELIAQAPNPVILLGHNGPHGLGGDPHDPFGIDFRPGGGDHGDRDLNEALSANSGKVALVVAGHMHHKVKGSRQRRRYFASLDGVPVVNGARVPRHAARVAYYLEMEAEPGRIGTPCGVWFDRDRLCVVEREEPAVIP